MLDGKKLKRGFTLIEVVIVITIIGILILGTVPMVMGYINKVKQKICQVNCQAIASRYHIQLELDNSVHNDVIFELYMEKYDKEICPSKGNIKYIDGEMTCEKHQSQENEAPIL